MDGAAQDAAVLCACKAAFQLLLLPSLAASNSVVSFCCCCLLLFTDLLVAAFLSFLCIFEPCLNQLNSATTAASKDIIALRFLLFLSHLYVAVLLLCPPLIAAEALTRPSRSAVAPKQRQMDSDCLFLEEKKEEEKGEEGNARLSHAVSYVCCLSLWFTAALDIRWRSRSELLQTAVCLQMGGSSLLGCLPTSHSTAAATLNPGLATVSALLILLFLLVRATSKGSKVTVTGARPAVQKNESSCTVLTDCVLVCPEGREDPSRTLTLGVGQVTPQPGYLWPQVIGVAAILLVLVLPPVLSVNILLIRTVEYLLELSVKTLLGLPRKGGAATPGV